MANININMLCWHIIEDNSLLCHHIYIWYLVICVEISSSEVFNPKGTSPYTTLSYMKHINTQYRVLFLLDQKLQYQTFLYVYYTQWHITEFSSSCSGRIRFDSCSLYQNEIGPSVSSSVVLCVFVLLVYIVVLV